MKFTEHRDSSLLMVYGYRSNEVQINEHRITQSCYLNHKQLFQHWDCHSVESLNELTLQPLLELKPEVILLGTGEKQQFPPPKLFALCAQQGIGLEVMDNAAACRTYNVLTTEEREVVLGLIFTHSTPD